MAGLFLAMQAAFLFTAAPWLAYGWVGFKNATLCFVLAYLLVHLFTVLISMTHALGLLYGGGVTAYNEHLHGINGQRLGGHISIMMLLAIVIGPMYTSYALLAPFIRYYTDDKKEEEVPKGEGA